MAGTSQHVVESFHINVGLGDSAIHVWSTKNIGPGTRMPKAVLVDGGLAQGGGVHHIFQTIKEIEKRYELKNGTLKFVSVVITHWDADHWEGINSLLENEKELIVNGQYQRFYYKKPGQEIVTTVYAPNIPSPKGQITFKYRKWPKTGCAFQFGGQDLAEACVGEGLIGIDFFANAKPSPLDHGKIQTLSELIGQRPSPVGMYCIASNLAVVGNEGRKSRRGMALIDALDSDLPTETNRQSIGAIIVWASGHISHYFAGDLDSWGEVMFSKWLENNMHNAQKIHNITCIKSSHHGARNSNPPRLFLAAKPKRVVFSAHERYGHPCWEVLFMLYAFVQIQKAQYPNVSFNGPCVFTCYPYWLKGIHGLKGMGDKKINVDYFLTKKAHNKRSIRLKKVFADLFDRVKPEHDLPTMVTSDCQKNNSTSPEEVLEWIAMKLSEHIGVLSLDLWKWCLDDGDILNTVTYVGLTLVDNAAEDGAVFYASYLNKDPTRKNIETKMLDNKRSFDSLEKHSKKSPSPIGMQLLTGTGDEVQFKRMRGRDGEIIFVAIVAETPPTMPYNLRLRKYQSEFTQGSLSVSNLTASKSSTTPRIYLERKAAIAEDYSHSILSSSYAALPAGQDESLDNVILHVKDWLDDFLLTMRPSVIRLASALIDDGWTLFHQDDALTSWMRAMFAGSQLSVNGDGPKFRLETPYGLTFATDEAAKAMGVEETQITLDGMSPWFQNGTMLFGLDPNSKPIHSSWTTRDILELFPTDSDIPLTLTALLVSSVVLEAKWTLSLDQLNGKRNAVWLSPIANNRTVLRLVFTPAQNDTSPLRDFLQDFFPSLASDNDSVLAMSNVQLIYRKTCLMKAFDGEQSTAVATRCITLSAVVKIQGPKPKGSSKARAKVEPTVSLDFATTGSLTLNMVMNKREDSFTAVVAGWLAEFFPGCDASLSTLDGLGISRNFWFRRLTMSLGPDKTISNASVAVEAMSKLGKGAQEQNVAILFEAHYDRTDGQSNWSISGDLWFHAMSKIPLQIYSGYETFHTLEPVTENPAKSIQLTALFASIAESDSIPELPAGIPDAITAAGFRIDTKSVFVRGRISDCRHVEKGSKVPLLSFKELEAEARWNWDEKKARVDLYFQLQLRLPESHDGPEACMANTLMGSVSYETGGKWRVMGGIRDLNLGMMYEFFPEAVRDDLYPLLKGIRLVDMSVVYESKGAGVPSELICRGRVMIGDVVSLSLLYRHSADGEWELTASLEASIEISEAVTLGQIMDSLVDGSDTSLLSSLPDFLADTVILDRQILKPRLELSVTKEKENGVKLIVNAGIMGLEVEFIQMIDKGKEPKDKDSGDKKPHEPAAEESNVLRLFKATLTKIPMPQDIPVLSKMDQPFDELGFFWVNQAVSSEQLAAMDDSIALPSAPPGHENEKPAVAMNQGFHFCIISKNKVVLDYPIGKARSDDRPTDYTWDSPPEAPEPDPVPVPGPEDDEKKSPMQPSQSTKAKFKNNMGPLNIFNVGIRYDGETLAILMDATIALGPVAVDLMGFTLGLHLRKGDGTKTTLHNLSWHDVEVSISGLGVQLDRPPLFITGAILHEKTSETDAYAGGLTVGFEQWLFEAEGFYGAIGDADDPNRFKCLFAYAMLRGPLMNIAGFAEISGLTGGFGYNIDLTLPTLDNVASFPLLKPEGSGSATMSQRVRSLLPRPGERGPFFNPQDGAMFVAAGLTVTAFQMLEITALVAVQWSPRVQIAMLGLAKCDVPATKAEVKFAHVELGIIATVDLNGGLMKLEAQLSPNSWIIHRSCQLTGGFAFYYWFGGGRTDWVMTMGGYHSAFVVPAHYPKPDRLRIYWMVDSSLSITGEAYFAVTPKVCMGGLRLHAALSLGALQAWFDASADFLINYAPFHFTAGVSVSIGVRFSMDVWFVTISIAVEVAASLMLMGPPLRGIVHVDFWVFGFDIAFGNVAGATVEPAISLDAFWRLVTQADGNSAGVEPGKKDAHLLSCNKGLLTTNNTEGKSGDLWLVRSGLFQFTVECHFAVNLVMLNGQKAPMPKDVVIDDIYAQPMHLTQSIDSTIDVDIGKPETTRSLRWKAQPAWKDVPQALWGKYDPAKDPAIARNGNNLSDMLNSEGGMARLLMGVVIEAPPALVSLDKMPAFLVNEALRQDVFDKGQEPPFLKNETDSEAFLPLAQDQSNPWTALQDAWEAAADPQPAVNLWQNVFGWTDLSVQKPANLIKHTETLFLSAPVLGKRFETAKSQT